MRYAAAPLGDLRWRAPVDPIPSDPGTVEKAVAYRSICLGIGASYPADDQSEDCLFVNVWAPTNATAESRLPVWVFIQGGGYVANTNANWDGNEVVERSGHNIVMVDFNYRVGLWGFLASERVREDGALNAGLLDQRMLLKWVKTHIASFGGDPDHVVIHGASAGAGSVAMHLIAYGGRNDNLFIGGMSESLFFPAQPFVRELEYQFDRVVSQTGCERDAPDQQMACLRSKEVATLQAANHAQPFPGRPDPPMPLFYWTPCVDGQLLPDLPYRLFQKGQFIDVPMVLGTSNDEGSVFAFDAATSSDVAVFLRNNYPLLTSNDTTAILAHYPQLPPVPAHNPWFPTASRAYGEATFICPTHTLLSSYLSVRHPPQDKNSITSLKGKHKPLYAYRYNVPDDYALARGLGVPHLSDAPAIFGPGNVPGAEAASYDTYNAPIVDLVMAYWVSFVRALDPNAFDLAVGPPRPGSKSKSRFRTFRPKWEPVWEDEDGDEDGDKERMMAMKRLVVETEGARMEAVDAGERERCEFWKGLGSGRMRQKK
ncbi:Alpha/Beta hydrolase protein [Corynascus novoguineensis]|uniref:Carboxylic ester hydrolase n=1 Tax=Corynascus novoguineensis TaxID=1126955 RepID=A0AAN7HT19_9PEZI|nr:Alpha/Beta hydrolase protein [Corynascus novoguineensis]